MEVRNCGGRNLKEEGSGGSWTGLPRAGRRGDLSGQESEGLGMKLRERGREQGAARQRRAGAPVGWTRGGRGEMQRVGEAAG